MPARAFGIGTLLLLFMALSAGARAAELRIATGPMGSGVVLRQHVKSATELRKEGIVQQQYDYSCGSAALATIFIRYLGRPVTEKEIVQYILEHGDLKKIIARRGFSLLELKQFAESRGATAVGYAMDFEALAEQTVPVLVPIKLTERLHFVVVRGVRDNRVYLADPALGRWTISAEEFQRIWTPKVGLIVQESHPNGKESQEQGQGLAPDPEKDLFLKPLDLRTLTFRLPLYFVTIQGEFR